MKKGDRVFFYHTGDEKQIVGIAKVLDEPYPDPGDKTRHALGRRHRSGASAGHAGDAQAVKADPAFADFAARPRCPASR